MQSPRLLIHKVRDFDSRLNKFGYCRRQSFRGGPGKGDFMRNILCGVLLLMIGLPAFASNDPVPGNTLLTRLPDGTRLVVKAKMNVYEQNQSNDPGIVKIFGSYSYLSLNIDNNTSVLLEEGTPLPIVKTVTSINEVRTASPYVITSRSAGRKKMLVIEWVNSRSLRGAVWLDERDGELPNSVDDFNRWLGKYFQVIYDDPGSDPYPGMEKGLVLDIVMGKITAALKANKYAEALPHFALLERQGTALPESFYYYYTDTLEKAGQKDKARAGAATYLKNYGKTGRYYPQVIELMGRL